MENIRGVNVSEIPIYYLIRASRLPAVGVI